MYIEDGRGHHNVVRITTKVILDFQKLTID